MQVYVDDPVIAIRGTERFRRTQVALVVFAWLLIGIPLASTKGQFAASIDWIGARISSQPAQISASIPQGRLDELRSMIAGFSKVNVIIEGKMPLALDQRYDIASDVFVPQLRRN